MKNIWVLDTIGKVGKWVDIYGWVDSVRDHKEIAFIHLRDRSGLVQVVGHQKLKNLNLSVGDVVRIKGKVSKRPAGLVNKGIKTGEIEIEVEVEEKKKKGEIELLSRAEPLPLPTNGDGYDIDEDVRLKYRYLDLRRPRLRKNLLLRAETITYIREHLSKKKFVEIETPILTKTTPEGARDFLVPSRLFKGEFYALPQSPQQYKQLLMVAGMERYFQIARCFRDEDARADRAYGEFTQLDLEMSFVTQETILSLIEELFTGLIKNVFPEKRIARNPWPRITYKKAIKDYGTDKPDLRKNKKDKNELAFAWIVDFPLFVKQSEEDYFHGLGKAKFAPSHHMFTSPHPDDVSLLSKDPLRARGLQHDLVLNGFEVGGGSIRIHDYKVQKKVFDLIGFSEKQKRQFRHLLRAFKYGVPPHGGIALGVDRLLMAFLSEPSLREVIAFPASASGKTAVMKAPSSAENEQLQQLGIKVVADGSKKSSR